jgi:hypothetical protein
MAVSLDDFDPQEVILEETEKQQVERQAEYVAPEAVHHAVHEQPNETNDER